MGDHHGGLGHRDRAADRSCADLPAQDRGRPHRRRRQGLNGSADHGADATPGRPQVLRGGPRHQGRRPRDRDGRVHGLRRPLGLRQVHAAPADRRARGHHLGRHALRRPAGQRPGAVEARHRHGVPVLRALPAHERLRQHGLRHEAAEGRRRRHQGAGDEGGQAAADRPPARPPAEAALRRPAPARGDRPRHRARPAGLPVRRAALQPRRRAARATRLEIAKLHHSWAT